MTYEKLPSNMTSYQSKMIHKGDLADARQRLKESTDILEKECENYRRIDAELKKLLGEKYSLIKDLIDVYKKGAAARSARA